MPHCLPVFEMLKKLLKASPEKYHTMIEIGTGNGEVLESLSRQFPEIEKFIGIDLSADQIEFNTKKYQQYPNIDFVAADGAEWIRENGTDNIIIITSGGVLEYFTQQQLKHLFNYLNHLKISLENLLVISDDLNLDFGNIRLRKKGSHGGHNGHKNIIETLKTSSYCRLRFGIGKNFHKGNQVKYVLSKWSQEEQIMLEDKLDLCSKIILYFVLSGIEQTMCDFNK